MPSKHSESAIPTDAIRHNSHKGRNLTKSEIQSAFNGEWSKIATPILSPTGLAEILGLSPKTIYEWISRGRLDGAFKKRGKHNLIWRDRALDIIFNGEEWT